MLYLHENNGQANVFRPIHNDGSIGRTGNLVVLSRHAKTEYDEQLSYLQRER